MEADPEEWQKPQAVVLPGFVSGRGSCGVLLSQRRILKLWAQISILLLQQLRVHRQQTVCTDMMEGDLSRGQRKLCMLYFDEMINFKVKNFTNKLVNLANTQQQGDIPENPHCSIHAYHPIHYLLL